MIFHNFPLMVFHIRFQRVTFASTCSQDLLYSVSLGRALGAGGDDPYLVGGDWNMADIWLPLKKAGMIFSNLTNSYSYFSEGLKPPTRYTVLFIYIYIYIYIYI